MLNSCLFFIKNWVFGIIVVFSPTIIGFLTHTKLCSLAGATLCVIQVLFLVCLLGGYRLICYFFR